MTLLNHIGILIILFLVIGTTAIFDEELRKDWHHSILTSIGVWLLFEAFYWTIKIFF